MEELMGKEFKIDKVAGVDVNDIESKLSKLDINKEDKPEKKDNEEE